MPHLLDFAEALVRSSAAGQYSVKSIPAAADELVIGDSAAGYEVKRVTVGSLQIARPYRGTYDASTNLFPTSATATVRTGEAIEEGDYFPITASGTLGGTAVSPGDLLVAEVSMTDPQTTNAANWTIVQGVSGASADTNMMTQGLTNLTGSGISHNANNQDWQLSGVASLILQGQSVSLTGSDSGGITLFSDDVKINASTSATPSKLSLFDADDSHAISIATPNNVVANYTMTLLDQPPAQLELMTIDASGALGTQPISGISDTHIFDDGLAQQAADASHDQNGHVVTFDQSTAGSAMRWGNFAVKDNVPRILGADGHWWTLAIDVFGDLDTTDTGSGTL